MTNGESYVNSEGYAVVEKVADKGNSGANLYRAGLLKITELAESGQMDLVLATKRNRFFRDLYYRRGFERDLKRFGVSLKALDDTGNRIADGVMDLMGEEQRMEIARETRRGRMQRARSGEVVAGVPPYGFNFEVEDGEAVVVRKIFLMAASGTSLNGIASALEREGVPTPRGERGAKGSGDGHTWSRAVLRQMILSDSYLPHASTDLEALVERGNLDRAVLERLRDDKHYGVWWFNRVGVETYYEDGEKRRRFWEDPQSEWIAVPIPAAGVPRGHAEEARRTMLNNRAHSNAGRRFWELSGGILYCPCGRRMAAHTAPRKGNASFYYVCGLRRSNHGTCEHGVRYHRAEETERKVRALVLGFLSQPEEIRRRAEEYVESERGRLSRVGRDLSGWEGRLADTERRRSALIDLAADGTISHEDLRTKLSGLNAEREAIKPEIEALREGSEELERLEDLPQFAESLARDLPHLIDSRPVVRDYETIGPERTEEDPLGIYTLTPDRIRRLSEEGVARREREVEDERAAKYRAMYEDPGLRVVAHPDDTLEASWRFGEATLRKDSDTSKNKHATQHFHTTEHPIVQSFEPGEDWIWCFVDEMVMEPRN
ncbi:MAG TPA: recombinase family protein [Rubrobacter sp.]|nr:recombinase family protein [Rubrobacter sp.]